MSELPQLEPPLLFHAASQHTSAQFNFHADPCSSYGAQYHGNEVENELFGKRHSLGNVSGHVCEHELSGKSGGLFSVTQTEN